MIVRDPMVRSSHAGAAHARRPRVAGLADLAALLDADAVRGRARGGAGVAGDGQHVLHAATHLQAVEGKGGAADDAADERGVVALVEVAQAEQEVVAEGRAEGKPAGGRRRRRRRTRPNTTCLPSRCGRASSVMKNCDELELG